MTPVFRQLPNVGDVWGHYVDFDMRRMDAWDRIMHMFKYNKDMPFFDILVPTVDTVRFGFLLEKLLSVRHSVLFTGETGVGKVTPWPPLSPSPSLTHKVTPSPPNLPHWRGTVQHCSRKFNRYSCFKIYRLSSFYQKLCCVLKSVRPVIIFTFSQCCLSTTKLCLMLLQLSTSKIIIINAKFN